MADSHTWHFNEEAEEEVDNKEVEEEDEKKKKNTSILNNSKQIKNLIFYHNFKYFKNIQTSFYLQ